MRITIIAFFTILALQGCKKIEETSVEEITATPTNIKDAHPSDNFDWSTMDCFSVSIQVTRPSNCTFSGAENPVIAILDSEYKKITSGTVFNGVFTSDLCIPQPTNQIYIHLPETGLLHAVNLSPGQNSVAVAIPCLDGAGSPLKGKGLNATKSGDNCSSGCTREISTSVSSVTVSNGETVCLTGTLNGKVEIKNGGTLRVCGTATISNFSVSGTGDGYLIVTESGKATISNFNLNNNKEHFANYGTTTVDGSFSPNGVVDNYGTMTVKQSLSINGEGIFNNVGKLTVNESLTNNGKLTNGNAITVLKSFTNNSSGTITNTCKIEVTNDIQHNGIFVNSALLKTAKKITINSGANITLKDGAQFSTADLDWNGSTISCTGNTSVITVSAKTTINSGAAVTGSLDICDANGIETKNATFGANVVYCQSYVAVSECNPVGYGTPTVTDTDGDGVADELDQFPNDPTRSYSDAYPYAGYSIVGFEDLWPSIGDYDFNDVLLKYKVSYNRNSSNKYTHANVELILSALGAGVHNGVALQFVKPGTGASKFTSLSSNLITGVTGSNVTFEGDNVVMICNDVYSAISGYYNNVGDGPSQAPDTIKFTVTFNPSASQPSSLIPDVFIFRSNDRSYEIHLPDRPATKKANTQLFGTYSDRTNQNGKWYKTENNLPWGIEIQNGGSVFRHPLSKISLSTAYPEFLEWVGSNGKNKTEWYKSPVTNKVFWEY